MNSILRSLCLVSTSLLFHAPLVAQPAAPSVQAGGRLPWEVTVYQENFNQPTGQTFRFPEEPGKPTRYHIGSLGGWAQDGGVIAVTHGEGLGPDMSGAIHCVVRVPSPIFIAVQKNDVVMPMTRLGELVQAEAEAFVLTFDAKATTGKIVTVFLQPVSHASLREREWPSRIVLGRFTGTGAYETVRLSGAEQGSAAAFIAYARDAAALGIEQLRANLVFSLAAQTWDTGDVLQLDNIKLTYMRP